MVQGMIKINKSTTYIHSHVDHPRLLLGLSSSQQNEKAHSQQQQQRLLFINHDQKKRHQLFSRRCVFFRVFTRDLT